MSESVQRLLEELRNDARQVEQQIEVQLSRLDELACVSEANVRVGDSPEQSATTSHNITSGGGSSDSHAVMLSDTHTHTPSTRSSSSGGGGAAAGQRGGQLRERRPLLRDVQQRFAALQHEVEHALQRFAQLVQSMEELCRDLPPTSAAVRHAERLQSVLQEKRQALARVRGDLVRRSERLQLLPRVHNEVRRYEREAGVRTLMAEQQSLRHTQARVGLVLEQAQSTHAQLRSQRERFVSMSSRLTTLMERVPVIQTVLGRIHARRRRNAVVIGAVIALCVFVTFLAW